MKTVNTNSILSILILFLSTNSSKLAVNQIYTNAYFLPLDGSNPENIFEDFPNSLKFLVKVQQGKYLLATEVKVDKPGIIIYEQPGKKRDSSSNFFFDLIGKHRPFRFFTKRMSQHSSFFDKIVKEFPKLVKQKIEVQVDGVLNFCEYEQRDFLFYMEDFEEHRFLKFTHPQKRFALSDFNLFFRDPIWLEASQAMRAIEMPVLEGGKIGTYMLEEIQVQMTRFFETAKSNLDDQDFQDLIHPVITEVNQILAQLGQEIKTLFQSSDLFVSIQKNKYGYKDYRFVTKEQFESKSYLTKQQLQDLDDQKIKVQNLRASKIQNFITQTKDFGTAFEKNLGEFKDYMNNKFGLGADLYFAVRNTKDFSLKLKTKKEALVWSDSRVTGISMNYQDQQLTRETFCDYISTLNSLLLFDLFPDYQRQLSKKTMVTMFTLIMGDSIAQIQNKVKELLKSVENSEYDGYYTGLDIAKDDYVARLGLIPKMGDLFYLFKKKFDEVSREYAGKFYDAYHQQLAGVFGDQKAKNLLDFFYIPNLKEHVHVVPAFKPMNVDQVFQKVKVNQQIFI